MKGWRQAGWALALLLIGGCASARGPVSLADMAAPPFGTVDPAAPGEHAPAQADHPLNILVMSAGGLDGAFGAGVLEGWSRAGTRPSFDVVTGVSTGALAATEAFLGPDHDNELKDGYLGAGASALFRSRGPLAFLLLDSLYDTAPLRAGIARIIDERVLDEVAAEHRRGRRLYVASTNLDTGALVVWDLGAIASSGRPDRLKLYRDAVLASAAIPASFNPVYVTADGAGGAQMHVDGAVRAPLLLQGFMFPPGAGGTRVWVIVNTHLGHGAERAAVKPRVADIAVRASTEIYRTLTEQDVFQAYFMARRAGAQFNLAALPEETPINEAQLTFKLKDMQALYASGEAAGLAGAWTHEPPGLDPLLKPRP
jgi:predicted patatin/cPLA2 family phospholipase